MDVDDALAAARPAVSSRDADLTCALRDLVDAAAPRPRARRRRAAAAAALVAALGSAGVGTAAAAGVLPSWTSLTTSSGQECRVEVVAKRHDLDRIPFSEPERRRTLVVAQAFLRSFDHDSLDRERAVAEWQAAEVAARSSVASDERQPLLRGDDLEVSAVLAEVTDRLAAHLAAQGLDVGAIETISVVHGGCDL